jgi:Carboxypeptidase regulatory-like domain
MFGLFLASTAWPQATSSSSVSGLVTDAQNAAVPDAEVKLINTSTNETLVARTNDVGRYIFIDVGSGTYALTITKAGFSTVKADALQVVIGQPVTFDAVLPVSATATTVEVVATAGADLVTTNSSVGASLSGAILQDLPNMGRDTSTLALLQPGTTLAGTYAGATAGAVSDQNTYQIDGGNATDDMSGNVTSYQTNFTGIGGTQTNAAPSANIPTPIESVEEFKVSTFNQTADFNNSIGGQVQIATKRGYNQFHGSVYGYYFATNLGAANTWANNHTADALTGTAYTPLPKNHRDRFGVALGGPIAPKFLGGKTYFFFNYEGERFPNVVNYEALVPTPLMKLGVIQVPNASGVYTAYNLNPVAVSYGGVTYQPAMCGGALCDPRGLGISPVISAIWNKYEPNPNDYTGATTTNGATPDTYNTAGYLSTIRAPLTQNTYVGRIDHDFGDKWRFMTSYRYSTIVNVTTNQVDIGGALPGDTFGTPAAIAPRTQLPSFFVAGLTGTLTRNLISDFRFSYQREFWVWTDAGAPPQIPGLGGAVEIAPGNSTAFESVNALIPYNVNTQNTRTRFWDGHDLFMHEDLTWIKGKHLVQFGGAYQRNFDYHTRNDNGVTTDANTVYGIGSTNINFTNSPYIPSTVPSAQQTLYEELYSEVLGLVSQSQVAYTRSGKALNLQPVGSNAFDKSTIPYYNGYFSDTWKVKPNLTVTYSLGYALEMPPVEQNGKQDVLVDAADAPISTNAYIAQREAAALQGQVFNPTIGYALVGNVGAGLKYPYSPFYDEWSPRVSMAWNPKYSDGVLGKVLGNGSTVIRGGYSRIWGRLNGVELVLTPLLGLGLIQAVNCADPLPSGVCAGVGGATPANAYRIGVDGLAPYLPVPSATLAQPYYPGVNGNTAAGDSSSLDPTVKPQRTDNFTLSIQREIARKSILEVGYIGRIIRNEVMETDLDAVPYMTTLGGQTFAQAYANVYFAIANGTAASAIPTQPFFEQALGGASSATCKAYSSCTAYVATADTSLIKNTQVSDLWASLNNAASWQLGRTNISSAPTQAASIELINSNGYGNYNALYITWKTRELHGATILSNFTYGRALGTQAQTQASSSYTVQNPYYLAAQYGPNGFDYRFQYNMVMNYKTPWYKTQHGILGHALGGYTVSGLFTALSGAPLCVAYTSGSEPQAFGESNSANITAVGNNCALQIVPTKLDNSLYENVSGSNGIGTNNPTGLNIFPNPAAVEANFRRCILGYDTSCGGLGTMRGLPTWNLDAAATKDIAVWKEGRAGASLIFTFTNVLNHFQGGTPSLSLNSPTLFGRITGPATSNTPRNAEFGLRIHF